jgi:hypothetical protein
MNPYLAIVIIFLVTYIIWGNSSKKDYVVSKSSNTKDPWVIRSTRKSKLFQRLLGDMVLQCWTGGNMSQAIYFKTRKEALSYVQSCLF